MKLLRAATTVLQMVWKLDLKEIIARSAERVHTTAHCFIVEARAEKAEVE